MGQIVLVINYFSIYLIYHGRYIAIIGFLWVFSALRYILILLTILSPNYAYLEFFSELAGILGTFFLVLGVFDFIKKKVSLFWFVFFALSILWLVILSIVPVDFTIWTLFPYLFSGTVNIWAGYIFIKDQQYKTHFRLPLGIFFIIWGIHKYDYPFLRMSTTFAPIGFFISTIIEFLIAINILILYLYITRKNLLEVLDQLKKSIDIQNYSLKQIVKNIESFTALVDSIRNPLTVISGIAELKKEDQLELILSETKKIEDIVKKNEQSWIESESFFKNFEKPNQPTDSQLLDQLTNI